MLKAHRLFKGWGPLMRFKVVHALLMGAALAAALAAPTTEAGNYRLGRLFGGDFTLTDQNGERFSLRDARGKVVVMYFGFTSCADTCPTTLAKVAIAMRALGSLSKQVQPLFISVDAKRDTPEVLRDYVAYFHPGIVGLTGTQDEVEAVAQKYRMPVYVHRPDESGFYIVDHGSKLYLVDAEGTLANILQYEVSPEEIAAEIRELLHD
jgi:cytochrome oxidase Cu insertion factor (SCO1/SenC/PrrC family)